MTGFGFSEEQEMFRREMRNFAQRELAPGAKERAKQDNVPLDIIKRVADMGLLGINLPEKYGGQQGDWVSVGIALEELSRVDFSAAMLLVMPMATSLVLQHASPELESEWLPQLINGSKIVCLCLTEPDCGSDATAIKMSAVRDGDHYILNGEKTSISFGMLANVGVVFAKTDPSAGARGVSCFLVPLDLDGVSRSRFSDMGWHAIGRASIMLDDVRVPIGNRIGDEGKGFYMVMGQFDFLRVGVSMAALGLAQASLGEAIQYAKQRTAFGKPIAKFEGVSFKIAEHATIIEAARLLCYRTLWLKDQGVNHVKESAMCKWWCPTVAVRAIHDSLLIFGHVGYSDEYPIEQRLRDAIGFEIADGLAQIMKIIIARELLGREFLPY